MVNTAMTIDEKFRTRKKNRLLVIFMLHSEFAVTCDRVMVLKDDRNRLFTPATVCEIRSSGSFDKTI